MFNVTKIASASLVLVVAMFATASMAKAPAKFGGIRLPAGIQAQMSKLKDKPKKAVRSDECQSFEGSWAGTCTDNEGDTYGDAFTVEQDRCDSVYIGSLGLTMGGAASIGESSRSMFTATFYPQWSPARNAFNTRVTYSGRGMDEDVYYSGRGYTTWQVIDGKLVTRSSSEVEFDYFGQITVTHYTDECIYTKQN